MRKTVNLADKEAAKELLKKLYHDKEPDEDTISNERASRTDGSCKVDELSPDNQRFILQK